MRTDTSNDRAWGFRTRAVHAGAVPDAATGARAVPIYQFTSWDLDQALAAATRGRLMTATDGSGWQNPSADRRLQILRGTRTVAVLGASPNPARASNLVATYLLASTRSTS